MALQLSCAKPVVMTLMPRVVSWPVMLLPLCVPVVIFAAGAVAAAQQGLPWLAPIAWLGAALVMALVLAPLACATALRIALDA